MNNRSSLGWLMATLLAAIGAPAACGGSTSGSNGEDKDAGTGGTGGSAAGTGGTSDDPLKCTPVAADSIRWSGGFEECTEGYVHRVSAGECPPAQRTACDPSSMDATLCNEDADCQAAPNGFCEGFENQHCACAYSCRTDADCPSWMACSCQGTNGSFRGQCMPASGCKTDADCAPGQCRIYFGACSAYVLLCVMPPTPADRCTNDRVCGQGRICAHLPDGRRCTEGCWIDE